MRGRARVAVPTRARRTHLRSGSQSGSDRLRLTGADLDPTRPRLLGQRYADGKHTVVVVGLDVVSVGRLAQVQAAGEGPRRALPDVRLLALGQLLGAARANGENTAVHPPGDTRIHRSRFYGLSLGVNLRLDLYISSIHSRT